MLIQSRSRKGKSIELEQKQRTESEKEIKQFRLIKGKKIDKISTVTGLRKKISVEIKRKKEVRKKRSNCTYKKTLVKRCNLKDTVKN